MSDINVESDEEEPPMPKRALNHPDLPSPPGFSRGVEVSGPGRTIYLAGAAPLDDQNQLVGPGDVAAQADASMGKLAGVIKAAGGSMSDVVYLNLYMKDISQIGEIQAVRDKYLQGPVYPAMSGIQTPLAHPDWLIEIDGVAFIED